MTYSTNVPNASQSPALFPAQANTNFARLKTIVGANHKFNDTAATDDGYHQDVNMLPLSGAGLSPNMQAGQFFANSDITNNPLAYQDTADNLFQITPCMPLRAAVKFVGTASSPITGGNILFAYNVSSVTWTVAGQYEINFTSALPSVNYIVTGMVQPSPSQGTGYIQSFATNTPGQVFNTTFTIVQTTGVSGSLITPNTVQVMIYGG